MATEIVTQQKLEMSVLTAIAEVRMMQAYICEHIDVSIEHGPNKGLAGPDLVFQCVAVIERLDAIYDDLTDRDAEEDLLRVQ